MKVKTIQEEPLDEIVDLSIALKDASFLKLFLINRNFDPCVEVTFMYPHLFLIAKEGARNEFENASGFEVGHYVYEIINSRSSKEIRSHATNHLSFLEGEYYVKHFGLFLDDHIIEIFCQNEPEIFHRNS